MSRSCRLYLLPPAGLQFVLTCARLFSGLPAFEPPYYVYRALSGTHVLICDHDNDGKLDAMISAGSNLQVLRGNGDGSFEPHQIVASGGGFRHAARSEFNGDGIPDLAICDGGTTVRTFLGNAGGTFVHDRNLTTTSGNNCVVAADMNHDNRVDVITANQFSDKVSYFRSGGGGGFFPAVNILTGAGAAALTVADFNGDTHPDILAANTTAGTMTFLAGNGAGAFGPPTSVATLPSPRWIAVADFNEDGKLDAVVTSTGQDKVSIFPGDGSGGFGPPADFATGAYPGQVVTADVNGDSHADAVVCDVTSREVSVHYGLGTGQLQVPRMRYRAGVTPMSVGAADLNNDGRPDLVTPSTDHVGYSPANMVVLLSRAGGEIPVQRVYPVGESPREVVARDLNGDGFDDLLTANPVSDNVSVLISNGDGSFLPAVNYAAGNGPIDIDLGHVDNDGVLDYVTCDIGGTTISVARGLPNGTFQNSVQYEAGTNPHSAAFGDFNEDGFADVAVNRGQILFFLNTGSGTLSAPVPVASGARAACLAVADINEDGNVDLLTGHASTGNLMIVPGTGNGGVGTVYTVPLAVTKGVNDIRTVDIDNDGHLDLIVSVGTSDNLPGAVLTLAGAGDGSFTPTGNYAMAPFTGNLAVGDINHDGALDFVSLSQSSYMLQGMFGDGTGGFYIPFRLGAQNPYGVTFGDVDGDGALDLAATNVADNTVTVMRNILSEVAGVPDGKPLPSLLTVFPNPASRAVSISVDVDRDVDGELSVFDLNGRLVHQLFAGMVTGGSRQFTWQPDPAMAEGHYFIRLSTGDRTWTSRVLWTRN